jgi:hypothetical protein
MKRRDLLKIHFRRNGGIFSGRYKAVAQSAGTVPGPHPNILSILDRGSSPHRTAAIKNMSTDKRAMT